MHKHSRDVVTVVALAVVYVLAARAGLSFDPVGGFATLVWPPTGISLAALFLLGYRVWPGVFIGATVANVLTGAPLAVALGIGLGNTMEALVGAYLLRRVPRFMATLENVRSVVALIVLAALFSTTISATIGVASLSLGGVIALPQVRETWRAWWVGDIVGDLLVAPVILVWSRPPHTRFRQHWLEKTALAGAILFVSVLTFFGDARVPMLSTPFHQADLLLAVMIWAALRFGQRGATLATLYVSATAVAATALSYGPFVLSDLNESLMSLQTFMAIVAVTFLLLGGTMSEQRAARDRERAATAEAARANSAKSDFLAVMSHELRTPLNAIAGYSQLLKTGIYGALSEKQRVAVSRIDLNERELLALIDQVLTFVKLEKEELSVRREHVHVAEAFDAIEPLIQPEIQRKHFVLKRDVRPWLAVQADRKGLQQILVSLLSNASKFTKEGGVITLGAERVNGDVRIWVRDTGVGIPEEEIPHVFDPFFQIERGTTRHFAGVGLGLTVARDLARLMSGDVTITSKVGGGTTASVVLPAA